MPLSFSTIWIHIEYQCIKEGQDPYDLTCQNSLCLILDDCSLNWSHWGLKAGLEGCKALTELKLANNRLGSLCTLPALPKLERLCVSQNPLTSLRHLERMTSLRHLRVGGCSLTRTYHGRNRKSMLVVAVSGILLWPGLQRTWLQMHRRHDRLRTRYWGLFLHWEFFHTWYTMLHKLYDCITVIVYSDREVTHTDRKALRSILSATLLQAADCGLKTIGCSLPAILETLQLSGNKLRSLAGSHQSVNHSLLKTIIKNRRYLGCITLWCKMDGVYIERMSSGPTDCAQCRLRADMFFTMIIAIMNSLT